MRRLSILCAAAGIAVTAFAAMAPAQAAFNVIRWQNTGFCQVWDHGLPIKPWPSDYRTVSHRVSTFDHALAVKGYLTRKHVCTF
jgi:hypothetical protein